MTIPITPKAGKMPLAMEFTPAAYRALLLQRMQLCLSGDSVILGTVGSVAPSSDIGPWFNSSSSCWHTWNSDTGQYEPADIGIRSASGTGNFGVTINGAPTAARTLTLPNATGNAVLVQDISIPKETVILTSSGGTVSAIDANVSNSFLLTLTENSTIPSLTNMASGSGKKIRIAIVNDGTSFTVTWPTVGANEIKWPASPSHTQPVATPSRPTAMAIYTIQESNVGLTPHLWGEPEVSGFGAPSTDDTGGADSVPAGVYNGNDLPPPKGKQPYNIP